MLTFDIYKVALHRKIIIILTANGFGQRFYLIQSILFTSALRSLSKRTNASRYFKFEPQRPFFHSKLDFLFCI